MKRRDPKERAGAGLEAAVARYARERAPMAGIVGRDAEPWPGGLYVLPETADFSVEWLLVERERRGRCRIVAADTHPLLGLADVAIPPEAPGGPLSVRCAVGLSIEIKSLKRGQRTGTLTAEDLDLVRRRYQEQDAAVLADSRLGAGREPDPDYEDWLDEVLLPARAALSPAVQREAAYPRRRGWNGVAVGVAVALLLALFGASALAWRYRQAERQAWREVHRLQEDAQRAHAERQRLLAAHRQELAALQAAEVRRLAELRAEVQAAPPTPPAVRSSLPLLANLAYVTFYPGEARGTVRELSLSPGAAYLLAVFYVGQQPAFAEYRLEMNGRSGAPAWSVPGLKSLPSEEVSVAFAREQLPDDVYHLHLYGISGGERKSVGEYELRIRSRVGLLPDR
jgi:hypothetical protein